MRRWVRIIKYEFGFTTEARDLIGIVIRDDLPDTFQRGRRRSLPFTWRNAVELRCTMNSNRIDEERLCWERFMSLRPQSLGIVEAIFLVSM